MDWPLLVIKIFVILSIIVVLRVLRVLWHAGVNAARRNRYQQGRRLQWHYGK
jgi:hypothetical protein